MRSTTPAPFFTSADLRLIIVASSLNNKSVWQTAFPDSRTLTGGKGAGFGDGDEGKACSTSSGDKAAAAIAWRAHSMR